MLRVIIILLTLLNLSHISAQQITPTPAPTKTPQNTKAATQTTEPPFTRDQPFTQADLSVITANTQRPNGIVWHDNYLYTVCSGDWTIYKIDADTGATGQYIYGVRNAHTLYATESNHDLQLWIPDFQTDTLVRIQRGIVENITTGLDGPWGIAALEDNNFIVTNLKGNNATKINSEGKQEIIISNLRSPTGVATDQTHIYIANTGSARRAIEWFSIEQINEEDTDLPLSADAVAQPLVSGLQNTTGLVIASDGMLYFSYALGTRGVVGRVDPEQCINNGGCSNDQVEIILYTELAVPLAGLTISPDMRLYIHSMFSPDLYWVQLPTAARP